MSFAHSRRETVPKTKEDLIWGLYEIKWGFIKNYLWGTNIKRLMKSYKTK